MDDTRDAVEVRLTLRSGDGPVEGTIDVGPGPRHFDGWMELFAALETVRVGEADTSGDEHEA